jgi:membrane protease YdiL (CAAX protease family)
MLPLSIVAVVMAMFLTYVTIFGIGAAVGTLAGVKLNWDGEPTFFSPFLDNILFLFAIAAMTPLTLILVRVLHRRPSSTLHSVDGRLRWWWLAACFALGMCSASLMMISAIWVEGGEGALVTVPWEDFLRVIPLILVLVPLQAAGEEYLVRGFMLQSFGICGRIVAVVGTAATFAAMHGFETLSGFTALFIGSVVWALLVIHTGGLEVTIAAHAASNLLAFLLIAASGGLNVADDTSAANADWRLASIMLGGDLAYACGILGLLRLLGHYRPGLLPRHRTAMPLTQSIRSV